MSQPVRLMSRVLLCGVSAMVVFGASITALNAQVTGIDDAQIERIKQQPLNVIVGLGFLVSNPQGVLADSMRKLNLNHTGFGLNLYAGYYMDPIPVAFTAEVGFSFHGTESKRVILSQILFRDTVDYETSSFNVPMNVAVRLQPNIATWVYPYVEIVGGASLFNSTYSVKQFNENRNAEDSESDASVAWQYGVGAGVSVKVADLVSLPNALQRILVDTRMRYLWSSALEITRFDLQEDGSYKANKANVAQPQNIHFTIGIAIQF